MRMMPYRREGINKVIRSGRVVIMKGRVHMENNGNLSFGTAIRERETYKLKEPGRYAVIMCNDDFTPMEFVVEILVKVFYKSLEEATQLMLSVHKGGQAVVGRYTYDVAVSKRARAMEMAKAAGYPFRVEVKEE